MILNAKLQVGELTGFLSYVMQVLNSMMMLSMVFTMIVMSRASMERIAELLRETPDIQSAPDGVSEGVAPVDASQSAVVARFDAVFDDDDVSPGGQ